ncbi:hypothetical protein QPK31_15140 [Massilia sp. YIM B02769]|uniref:GapS4b family protein n=1 Tax=Massilia sp. YIM B02769 TaxID=3050129 RepID=UPI0025B6FCA7|nr:hypothetical protein [Massilia sp. YIM B02769]MDN4059560.1 hypothetical protein [Massilia sp. YIM B02769]
MTDSLQKKIEADNWLPHGEQLRILLGSDHISYGEVASTLRAKGVFCANNYKEHTIPILASSILRPDEFVALLETSISRETKPKEQPQEIKLVNADVDWQSCIRTISGRLVDLVDLDKIHGVRFTSNPTLAFDGTHSASIEYKINRRDYSQDLLGRDLNFTGKIVIKQQGRDLRLEVLSQVSSRETQKINDQILKTVTSTFKQSGVSRDSEPLKILFGSFENKSRILFFLKIAAHFGGNKEPGTIVDVTIRRNERLESLPDAPEIKWMEGAVRNLKIDGDKLNDIALFASKEHYEYFFITKLMVEYSFQLGPNTGTCTVIYNFDRIKTAERIMYAPFMYSVDRVTISGGNASAKTIAGVRQQITDTVRRQVNALFSELRKTEVGET